MFYQTKIYEFWDVIHTKSRIKLIIMWFNRSTNYFRPRKWETNALGGASVPIQEKKRLFSVIRLLSAWLHWHSVSLARQARMTSPPYEAKNFGSHTIARALLLARANHRTCTYFLPKQTAIEMEDWAETG